jgi:hypothetical protein
VVAGRIGELVDHVLRHFDPVGNAFLADAGFHLVCGHDDFPSGYDTLKHGGSAALHCGTA